MKNLAIITILFATILISCNTDKAKTTVENPELA